MAKGGYRPGAGRPKAQHTIQAEAAKAELINLFLKEKKPIFEALIRRAKEADMSAMKELFERVWGKESQPFDGNLNHKFDDLPDSIYQAILARESQRASIKISSD